MDKFACFCLSPVDKAENGETDVFTHKCSQYYYQVATNLSQSRTIYPAKKNPPSAGYRAEVNQDPAT
jgi:hypothetical protein